MIWLFLSVPARMREYGVEISEHGILTGQLRPLTLDRKDAEDLAQA